jgi:hypothetical protein
LRTSEADRLTIHDAAPSKKKRVIMDAPGKFPFIARRTALAALCGAVAFGAFGCSGATHSPSAVVSSAPASSGANESAPASSGADESAPASSVPQELLGTWKESDDANGWEWSYTLNQDGSYSYTFNGAPETGTFTVNGSVITFQPASSEVNSLNPRTFTWSVTQPTDIQPYWSLSLTDSNGNSSNMIKSY